MWFRAACSKARPISVMALNQGDYEALCVFGHRMKGIGGSYGLEAITEIGRALEQAALNHRSGEMEELLDNLLDYLNRVEVV